MFNDVLGRSLILSVCLALFVTMTGPALAARPVESDDMVTAGGWACFLPLDWRAPFVEQWIEVSLRDQVVRLCEGERVLGEYLAATGRGDGIG